MSSTIGMNIRLSIFGESHSDMIGAVIDGLPAGESIDQNMMQEFMERRHPGLDVEFAPRILSGVMNGKTCGAPMAILIGNENAHTQSDDKASFQPRPGHADFSVWRKYNGLHDSCGSGHLSSRLTEPLCFAGAICKQILLRRGVTIGAHILSIGNISDAAYDPINVSVDELLSVSAKKPLSVIDDSRGQQMQELIAAVSADGDSVGGQIECCALGVPAGIGDPIFDGVENRIAQAIFGIPAVRGIDFGSGFDASNMRGSQHNDEFVSENGVIKTTTNRHGGVLGGISTGMPLIFRAAFKPSPSISKAQQTIDLQSGESIPLELKGKHDTCTVVRAVPCIEAAAAVQILDMMLSDHKWF